jgi:hypothetical protein
MLVAPHASKQLGCMNTIEAWGTLTKKTPMGSESNIHTQAIRRGQRVWRDGGPLLPLE